MADTLARLRALYEAICDDRDGDLNVADLANEAADLIGQQAARIAELESEVQDMTYEMIEEFPEDD